MYIALSGFTPDLPLDYWRWKIAKEIGWTLDYIDTLTVEQFHQYLQIRDAEIKAKKG